MAKYGGVFLLSACFSFHCQPCLVAGPLSLSVLICKLPFVGYIQVTLGASVGEKDKNASKNSTACWKVFFLISCSIKAGKR